MGSLSVILTLCNVLLLAICSQASERMPTILSGPSGRALLQDMRNPAINESAASNGYVNAKSLILAQQDGGIRVGYLVVDAFRTELLAVSEDYQLIQIPGHLNPQNSFTNTQCAILQLLDAEGVQNATTFLVKAPMYYNYPPGDTYFANPGSKITSIASQNSIIPSTNLSAFIVNGITLREGEPQKKISLEPTLNVTQYYDSGLSPEKQVQMKSTLMYRPVNAGCTNTTISTGYVYNPVQFYSQGVMRPNGSTPAWIAEFFISNATCAKAEVIGVDFGNTDVTTSILVDIWVSTNRTQLGNFGRTRAGEFSITVTNGKTNSSQHVFNNLNPDLFYTIYTTTNTTGTTNTTADVSVYTRVVMLQAPAQCTDLDNKFTLYYAGGRPPSGGSSNSSVAPSSSNASVSDLGPSSKNVPVVAPTRAINNNPSDPLAGGFGSSQSPTPPAGNSSGPIADPSLNTGGQSSSPSTGVVDSTSSTGVIREAG